MSSKKPKTCSIRFVFDRTKMDCPIQRAKQLAVEKMFQEERKRLRDEENISCKAKHIEKAFSKMRYSSFLSETEKVVLSESNQNKHHVCEGAKRKSQVTCGNHECQYCFGSKPGIETTYYVAECPYVIRCRIRARLQLGQTPKEIVKQLGLKKSSLIALILDGFDAK